MYVAFSVSSGRLSPSCRNIRSICFQRKGTSMVIEKTFFQKFLGKNLVVSKIICTFAALKRTVRYEMMPPLCGYFCIC